MHCHTACRIFCSAICFLLPVSAFAQTPLAPPGDASTPVSSTDKAVADHMPELGEIPSGAVRFSINEDWPANDRWLTSDEDQPGETMSWTGTAFLLPRIPARFDPWGIRDDWDAPILLRVAADVTLPVGRQRIILRARAFGRLWWNGQVIAVSQTVTRRSPDGEQPISPNAVAPAPGLRPAGYHQQEIVSEILVPQDLANRPCRVVLELIVGGKGVRTETGEVVVAFQSSQDAQYYVLTPTPLAPLSLANESVERELEQIKQALVQLDTQTRRASASSMDGYWKERHDFARKWLKSQRSIQVPRLNGDQVRHPIDAFIAAKIEQTKATFADTRTVQDKNFTDRVLPLLRDNCFRCHGEKQQGGLKLDSREAALSAGESMQPAIVPGDPESSELVLQLRSGAMPPTETGLSSEQITLIEDWIRDGAVWPKAEFDASTLERAQLINDEAFLRRAFLDTVGVPPSLEEVQEFIRDQAEGKRERLVERLVGDRRVADHFMSFWQDLLAENPTLVNASMGSTGPFRWFLHDALADSKSLDRMITELILMRGSIATGGSAAFGLAGESDSPFAEKAHIIASAFLGVELQCARCHDSPYHSTTQSDLYSLAAMLARKEMQVPNTSRVPVAFFEKNARESLIKVTLKPDAVLKPTWTLQQQVGFDFQSELEPFLIDPADTRERLALLITAPQNERMGRVMVNRIWERLMGAGIVQPIDDWEGATASHPEMLDWLTQQLIQNDYDFRSLLRIIMTSQAYQSEAIGKNAAVAAEHRFFNAPDRRRMTAEQVVDSLHAVTGKNMDCEELTFVHDGARPLDKRQSLGKPSRAWMFASLNNERDRPSLSLPRARAIVDVLKAFDWDGARQRPISQRGTEPNVLQPGILANGALVQSLIRVTPNSTLATQALHAEDSELLVEQLFWQILTRPPTIAEKDAFVQQLNQGFASRQLPESQRHSVDPLPPLPLVTWFNHLRPEATRIQQEHERRVAEGPMPDLQFDATWRTIYEDAIWSLINHRDFIWIP